ncbi:MAG: DUF1330 domain-containing protein [Mycobacteriales bacterium]
MSPLVFVINIHDPAMYAGYRSRIAPVMKRHGASVRAEYEVASTIFTSGDDGRVNRLAVLLFPSDAARDAFFQDPEYLAAKPLLQSSTGNLNRLVP